MKLNIEQQREEYDPLQDPFYLQKIKNILQHYNTQERLDRDYDATLDINFPTIREFFRMCARRQRPTLRPAAPLAAAVASCPMM